MDKEQAKHKVRDGEEQKKKKPAETRYRRDGDTGGGCGWRGRTPRKEQISELLWRKNKDIATAGL